MVTALYRRYRPENFAELIGQSQVTDPLRTALRTNRVNHAYLFSGPRGCGKTTSARILARCLNCEQGPTDTPCGVCPSCVELARGGGGSLDVIEIDAASHNGVDDARDLRDRAVFAPARDRYKIFILDEAHMVTPQGFNALLKLVEEPPEHVKFIFATTEPEKVIGTIRSRTHHYPFRLVPPATMLEYVEQLCEQESVSVAPGVLPLVVRAGGGSVRDTLSLLDQLMAGSEDGAIAYERAVVLLGYTDAALLDDVVDALAVADPASAFAAVDRVVQTGQDPRRFVEDLLERLRDLIVVAATNESAAAVLRGISPEELDTMTRQAGVFGATALSRSADIANRALTEMTGATSPRLHLELMTARMLVPEVDDTQRGALARVERLERRVGVGDAGGHQAPAAVERPQAAQQSSAGAPVPRTGAGSAPAQAGSSPATPAAQPAASTATPTRAAAPTRPDQEPADQAPTTARDAEPRDPGATVRDAAASWAAVATPPSQGPAGGPTDRSAGRPAEQSASSATTTAHPTEQHQHDPSGTANASSTGQGTAVGDEAVVRPVAAVGFQQLRDAWPQVVEHVQRARRSAWSVVVTAQVTALREDVLTLTFPSQQDVASFKEMSDPATSVSELLRSAIIDVLGLRVKFVARGPGQQRSAGAPASEPGRQTSQQQPTRPHVTSEDTSQQQAARQQSAPPQPTTAEGPTQQQQQHPTAPQQQPTAPQQQQQPTAPQQPSQQQQASQQQASQQQQANQQQGVSQQPTTRQQPATPSAPVTDWAVATIPATDPTAGAVPEHLEPGWSAPFGTTDTGEPVVPVAPVSDPAADAALAAQLRPASALGGAGTRPARAAAPSDPTPDAPGAPAPAAGAAPAPAAAAAPASAAPAAPGTAAAAPSGGPDVPVDDYPLDDEPYDDGAPFPDPGAHASSGVPSQRPTRAPAPQAAPAQTGSAQAAPEQAAPEQAAPAQAAPTQEAAAQPAPARTAAPQVRRTPVAGRYGEAVVREILGAQFIEETALHEEGA
ncbi:DNA polymerase III subunit gamma and tau [Curtobacterium sp. 20TX0008]|uniref:DNA polymerase III subunit gamma and tau n=1 Tax=Curtobacterium sp. 20TX0008 TaxID=3022018 RepID=UPI00232C7C27|nr:DNA polymerase III subunit gamma and tau [Curtobacterium sp. 20TX0008]MDB6425657.1 DNA polymerase III subunit gamma and tau [Curtobacterium sp. 20TX0008]